MREMKESEITWAGPIPTNWETIPTKYLFTITSGATPKSEDEENFDGNIVWITPADYKTTDVFVESGRRTLTEKGLSSCSAVLVPAGSIIFSKRAPIGSVAISATELCTNQGCLSCVPKTNDSTKYYYYLMSICTDEYNLLGTGTTFKEISATNFASFRLLRPPIDNQTAISAFLDEQTSKVDALIANQQVQIEKLKQYKQSLITEVVTKGLDPDVVMKDSGVEWIGEIPQNWVVTRIKYIIDNSDFGIKCGPFGSALTGKVIDNGEILVYGQWNIVNGDFLIRRNTISKDDYESLTSYKVEPNDVLVSMMGTIGKCAIVPQDIALGIMDSHVIKIRLNTDVILPSFFQYVYDKDNSFEVFEYFTRKKKGFIMDGLNTSVIKNAYFVLPPLEEQQKMVAFLNEKCTTIQRLMEIKQDKIEKLNQYKKSLIYEYVTGKKEV